MGNMGTFLRAETKNQTKTGVESMKFLIMMIIEWIRNHYDHFASNQSNQSRYNHYDILQF